MITIKELLDSTKLVVKLAADYKGAPRREMRLDGLLYGVLHSKYRVRRQHHVRSRNGRPKRIDFRQPGRNPVVIEFAVRTHQTRRELNGSQNQPELHKLMRQNAASARYLLLLDLARESLDKDDLKGTYTTVPGLRGRGPRKSVRIIYAHRTGTYHFLWQPKEKSN